MEKYLKEEMIERCERILSISGLFDDLRYYKSQIELCASMIINRCKNNYSKEVIETNISKVLDEMYSAHFVDNIGPKLNIIPLLTKLILEEDKSKYISIIKGYKSYFNEINIFKDLRYLNFINELKNAKSISVFSEYRHYPENFVYCFYYLGKNKTQDYPFFKIERKYYSNGHNALDNVIVVLNLDKATTIREAQQLKMKDIYYLSENEEGFINSETGILTPYKNPFVIREDDTIRLLEVYTSIDVFDDFDKSSYSAHLKFDTDSSKNMIIDKIGHDYEDILSVYKKKMIKQIEEDIKNGRY